ncbi:MAG: c-type cytochrome [Rufibacter sp.]
MFQKKLKVAAWLLNITILLLIVVVSALAYQLVTEAQNEVVYDTRSYCKGPTIIPEVIKNETGRTLFQNNCSNCHHFQSIIVGPPLAGVHKKHSIEWLYAFVKNFSEMIEKKDSAAVAVYNEYGKQQMPSFAFSKAELDSLFDYISAQESGKPAVAIEYIHSCFWAVF